jgi:hypothetical protein
MQIDSNEESVSAQLGSDEILQKGSTITRQMVFEREKQCLSNRSMGFGIVTSGRSPKYSGTYLKIQSEISTDFEVAIAFGDRDVAQMRTDEGAQLLKARRKANCGQ